MMEAQKYTTDAIRKLIEERPSMRNKGWGIQAEIGNALEDVPTEDLIRFYVEVVMRGNSSCIRDYVEQSIISWVINREMYDKYNSPNKREIKL